MEQQINSGNGSEKIIFNCIATLKLFSLELFNENVRKSRVYSKPEKVLWLRSETASPPLLQLQLQAISEKSGKHLSSKRCAHCPENFSIKIKMKRNRLHSQCWELRISLILSNRCKIEKRYACCGSWNYPIIWVEYFRRPTSLLHDHLTMSSSVLQQP